MPIEVTLVSAFLMGFLGSTHCLVMCGGIVGALTMGLKETIRNSPRSIFPYLILYNAGRITSYAIAGSLLGLVSAQLITLGPTTARFAAGIVSAGFMIALGLYLTGWWPGLMLVERGGGKLWRYIQPLGRRFLPVDRPLKAGLLGLVWGWLPCGMVYAALAWTLTAASAAEGALLMVSFGVGTLPMLMAMGATARALTKFARLSGIRQMAGIIILLYGVYSLYAAGLPYSVPTAGHHH